MEFRPYDILTQLVPGTAIVGFSVYGTNLASKSGDFNIGLAAFGVVICFLVGYCVNVVGHILESFFSKKLNEAVFDTYRTNEIKYFMFLFKRFTKLKHIEKPSSLLPNAYSKLYDRLNSNSGDSLNWLNEDKKFSRSIVVTCIVLYSLIGVFGLRPEIVKYYPEVMIGILLFISTYRYLQTSIDYTISVIKRYEKENYRK